MAAAVPGLAVPRARLELIPRGVEQHRGAVGTAVQSSLSRLVHQRGGLGGGNTPPLASLGAVGAFPQGIRRRLTRITSPPRP